MKKAIIVGATSGIGKELACILSGEGYELLLRRFFQIIWKVYIVKQVNLREI